MKSSDRFQPSDVIDGLQLIKLFDRFRMKRFVVVANAYGHVPTTHENRCKVEYAHQVVLILLNTSYILLPEGNIIPTCIECCVIGTCICLNLSSMKI